MRETMVDTTVTYTVEHDGKFYIIERVPARVCKETGEQYFSPETVEHIQEFEVEGNQSAPSRPLCMNTRKIMYWWVERRETHPTALNRSP